MNNVVAKVIRGQAVESVHCGSIAVVDAKGKLIYSFGDPNFFTFLRSSSKPFQVIPLLKSGAVKYFGFTDKEIAIMCGSHSGEPRHIQTVKSIFKKIGLSEKYLKCGSQTPLYYTANEKTPPLKKFPQIYHNCSAKHSEMLALCRYKGWSLKDYLNPDHPVQKEILKEHSAICQYPISKIKIGIEGCSAPAFALPLKNMAIGFANLVNYQGKDSTTSKIYKYIVKVMLKYPEMVSGKNRFDLVLMDSLKGKLICKGGAEALHCTGLLEKGWGITVRITDGGSRAVPPVVIETLRQLKILSPEKIIKIEKFAYPSIKNWRKIKIGNILPEFKLRREK
jgi:L-asparaginase II